MNYVAISAYGHMTTASCLAWVEHSWNSTIGVKWWGSSQCERGIVLDISIALTANISDCLCSLCNLKEFTPANSYIKVSVTYTFWSLYLSTLSNWYIYIYIYLFIYLLCWCVTYPPPPVAQSKQCQQGGKLMNFHLERVQHRWLIEILNTLYQRPHIIWHT